MRRLILALLCLCAVSAQADLRTDFILSLGNNEGFNLTVDNQGEGLESFTVALQGVGNSGFDTIWTGAEFPHVPDVDVNNDDVRAATVTWSPLNPNFGRVSFGGDIDGGVTGATVTFNYTSGESRSIDLVRTVTEPRILWEGNVDESSAPPAPIVDGQGAATLTWTAPTENEDGSPLGPDDLAGFALYWDIQSRFGRCGTDAPITLLDTNCYGNVLDIPDPDLRTFNFTLDIDRDTSIFFAMVAYKASDDGPIISDWSNEVQKRFEIVIIPPDEKPSVPTFDITVILTCTVLDDSGATCEVKEVNP